MHEPGNLKPVGALSLRPRPHPAQSPTDVPNPQPPALTHVGAELLQEELVLMGKGTGQHLHPMIVSQLDG